MASSVQSSTSTSTPTVIQTPENDIINQLSGVAAGLAQQMNQWAQGVFAQTSAITDQAVGNFFQVSQQMMGLSSNLTDQYNNIFAPQNASLASEADSYNSTARQQMDMGQAGATQAQAGDAALQNSEEQLRSYGIDPSSGRYASLDKAAAVQNAANVAGAMNTQRNADATTGQNLRSQAVQVGATLPASIANVNNTAIQANTGASNATLANANTGANLQALANAYLQTAMQVKLPPVGQTSSSQSSGSSSSPDQSRSSGSSGGGYAPTSIGANSPSGAAWMPQHSSTDPTSSSSGGGSRARTPGTAAGISSVPPNYEDPTGQSYDPLGGIDPNSFSGSYDNSYYQPSQGYNMDVGQSGANADTWNDPNFGLSTSNPFSSSDYGQTLDYGGSDSSFNNIGGGTDTQFGNISYDPSANNQGGASDWSNTYDQPSPTTDWGSGASNYGYTDYSNSSGGGYDTTSPSSDTYAGDYSMPSDSYDMGGAYAKGGPIPPRGAPQGAGRQLPASMSPSGGRQVDDIRARGPGGSQLQLNANEFVIPQDVALWKGQEFFQNLIEQSRKKRVTAPAKPSQTPPQQPMR